MSFGSIIQSGGGLSYPTVRPKFDLNLVRNRSIPPEYSYTRNSSGTYVGSDGLIKTAAVNEPRFEFDAVTGEYKGLLVEEARTNYYTTSETMLGGRINNSVRFTDFTIGGPQEGKFTRVVKDNSLPSAPSQDWPYQIGYSNTGLSIGQQFAVSFYARCPNGTLASIKLSNPDAEGEVFNIDSTWRRFTKVFTYGVQSGITFFRFNRSHSPSNVNGATFDLAALQIENRPFPTSYIPTLGSTVTRQPDQLVLNRTLNPQGAFYIESSTNTNVSTLVADNGVTTLVPPQGTKSALFYNTSRTLSMSSSTTPVEGNFSIPQNLNRVSLGFNRLNNTNYINGHLKKFMYYGSPVTEDNLRSLTGNTRSTFRFDREQIITDGLVLNLDAGNPASYPGSGTTWFDLSGNGNNGTLVNGVGYNSGNLGSLVFDGVDDKVVLSSSSSFAFGTGNLTVSGWGYVTSHTNYRILASTRPDNGGYANAWHIGTGANGIIFLYSNAFNLQSASNAVPVNQWFYWTFTRDTGIGKLFVNTIVVASGSVTNDYTLTQIGIGDFPISGSEPWSGRIPQVSIYNRALTASEIQQNFNALRSRYGI
jgi:hypothetical protein